MNDASDGSDPKEGSVLNLPKYSFGSIKKVNSSEVIGIVSTLLFAPSSFAGACGGPCGGPCACGMGACYGPCGGACGACGG